MKTEELKEKLEKTVQEMNRQRSEARLLLDNANRLEGQAALLEELIIGNNLKEIKENKESK